MRTPISPSNLRLADQCLYAFHAQYVAKTFKPSFEGAALERGLIIHSLAEHTVKHGKPDGPVTISLNKVPRKVSWEEYPREWKRMSGAFEKIAGMKAEGWQVFTEQEVCCDMNGRSCGWWADNCLARAKIDVLLINPAKTVYIIWDWKTGKPQNINALQLPMCALLAASTYGIRTYGVIDFLIDSEDSVQGAINIRGDLLNYARTIPEVDIYETPAVVPVVKAIQKLKAAYDTNKWPQSTGSKCFFCKVPGCENAGKRF